MAVTLEELSIKFTAEMGGLQGQLNQIKNQLNGVNTAAGKTSKAFAGMARYAKLIIGAYIGRGMIQIGKESISMANEAVESEALFGQSMKGMAAAGRKWSDSLSDSLGLNAYALRKNAGTFYNMFESMNMGQSKAYKLSTGLTELAEDMGSFYNIGSEDMFTKLRAGITGETEPLKRLGIMVDEATVKHYAMKEGIARAGEELTSQQKILARYAAIMDQTKNAQGDLARTIDSPVNQLRIMGAQLDSAKIALGQAFMPIQAAVLPLLTALTKSATTAARAIAFLMGSLGGLSGTNTAAALIAGKGVKAATALADSLGKTAEGYKKAGGAAKKASKDAKVGLKAFDEVNKIQTEAASGGGGGGGKIDPIEVPDISEAEDYTEAFETISRKIRDAADKIRAAMDIVVPALAGITTAWATFKIAMFIGASSLPALGLAVAAGLIAAAVFAIQRQVNRLKAIRIAKAFGDVDISLQEAATIVSTNLKNKTTDLLDAITTLQTDTDAALSKYAEASAYTKKVLTILQMLTYTTGKAQYLLKVKELKEVVDGTTDAYRTEIKAYLDLLFARGKIDIAEYNRIVERYDNALNAIEASTDDMVSEVTALIDATVKEGKAPSKAEVTAIQTLLQTRIKGITDKLTALKTEITAQIKADLKAGKITKEEAAEQIAATETAIQEEINSVTAAGVDLTTRITSVKWDAYTITEEQITQLTAAIQAELDAAPALVLTAEAEAHANFKAVLGDTYENSEAKKALEGIFSGGKETIAKETAKIQALLADGMKMGFTPELVAAVAVSRDTLQQAMIMITDGLTADGALGKAISGLSALSSEAVGNYIKASAGKVDSDTKRLNDALDYSISAVAAHKDEMAARGEDWITAIKELETGAAEAVNNLKSGQIVDAAKNIGPAISAAIKSGALNEGDVAGYIGQINALFEGADFSGLTAAAQAEAITMAQTLRDGFPPGLQFSADFSSLLSPALREAYAAGLGSMTEFEKGINKNSTAAEQALRTIGTKGMAELRIALVEGTISEADYNAIIQANAEGSLLQLQADMSAGANAALGSYITALLSKQAEVEAAAKAIADKAAAGIAGTDTTTTGRQFGQGYVNGINSMAEAARRAARDLGNAASGALKNTLEIKSPSKVTDKLGAFFGIGFTGGVRRMGDEAIAASEQLADKATSALKLGKMTGSLKNSVAIETTETEARDAGLVSKAVELLLSKLDIKMSVDGEQFGKISVNTINNAQRMAGRVLLEF